MNASDLLRNSLLQLSKSGTVRRTIERAPVSRSVVRRFVPGEATADAVRATAELMTNRLATIDYLGEDTLDLTQAIHTRDAYLELLSELKRADLSQMGMGEVSLKLTALGQMLLGDGKKIALEHAREICQAAADAGTTVTLDMEDHTTTDATLEALRDLRQDFPWVGAVIQSYLRRSEADCRDLAHEGSRVRLCKGAYKEPESVAFQSSEDVDTAYVRCLKILMAGDGYPMVASHDPRRRDRRRPRGPPRPRPADVRVPDALRHPARGTEADRRPRPPDAGLHPLRRGVVRLPHAPDG